MAPRPDMGNGAVTCDLMFARQASYDSINSVDDDFSSIGVALCWQFALRKEMQ